MPTYAPPQYWWSEQTQNYVLSIGETIRQEALSGEWLEQITSFAFHSRSGMHFTARKQKVQRGTNYWYGYRRLHGRLLKHYLGKTSDLTLARLEEVARLLENESGQNRISPLLPEEIAPSQSSVHIPTPAGDPHVLSVTAQPLLLSKLLPPRLPQFLLARPRLFALLDAGWRGCLTLLSAPAGFGKTTLVAQWVAARRALPDFPPVAWVSLEAADNDPLRFWRYLISACQAFQIDLTEAHAAWLASTPQPPFWPHTLETVATSLLNALTQCPAGSLLILEEYHAITAQEIHESLSFFLEHLPTTIHLVIITRSDPPFSLARLRANNQLCEIRTADLSFSQEEMTILLHHSLPFELSSPTIQHLHAQLEGWGVGLHLTRLALQRTTTQAAGEQVVSRFLSSHPSFHEYFVNEVLQQQPELIQQFLLQTSFLGYLTPSLCNAVTERQDSQEMLAFLEQTNVFCEALDPVAPDWPGSPQPIGQWYRYHALFAEAMRGEAQRLFGEEYLRLFAVRAALWYEMHGFLNEAIDAALQAQDYPRAAVLIERSLKEQAAPGEMQKPQIWHRWFTQFPEGVLEQHPILALSSAITLLFQSASWQPDTSAVPFLEKLLHMAEEGFRTGDQRPKLGELFAFRAVLAVRRGKFQDAIHDAEQALGLLQPEQQLWRGIALSMVSEKWIKMGQLRQARATLYEAQALCSTAHNRFFKRIALIKFAQVCFDLGEQQQAAASLRQTLSEAREEAPTKLLANWCCVALLSLAALSYESNELECAAQHLQEVLTLSQT
ncbi:MAG TPA: hypothetical protein VH164_10380, partial [Ktedonobacteraceae bacterium]|nr:hypothetical protein [Ktedonobacteraceae bacterium]